MEPKRKIRSVASILLRFPFAGRGHFFQSIIKKAKIYPVNPMLNRYLLVAALRIGSNEGKTRQMVAFGEQILFRLLFHPPRK